MNKRIEELFDCYLPQLGLIRVDNAKYIKHGKGISYIPREGIGTGYFWAYPINDYCYITMFDLKYNEDMGYSCITPEITSISSCTKAVALPIVKNTTNFSKYLITYSLNEEKFEYIVPKQKKIQNISVNFISGAFEQYLNKSYEKNFSELNVILKQIDGNKLLPEVNAILNQISTYVPRNYANMFYEAKVIELISILMDWYECSNNIQSTKYISSEDYERIYNLAHSIEDNLDKQQTMSDFTKQCYMGKTKLCYLFKQIYGLSISEYIKQLKVTRAKELLLDSDYSVKEISCLLGYCNQGSLSSTFKELTGLSPINYRRQYT